jgi:hypothetical protein
MASSRDMSRDDSDEAYVLALCEELLEENGQKVRSGRVGVG